SHDSGASWTACAGPEGRVIGFHFDISEPGLTRFFAATEQGIWRSDDHGKSWAEKTQGLAWKQLLGFAGGSNPKNHSSVLYCSTSSREENGALAGGIYRSRDGGESWQSAMGPGINTDVTKA